MNYIAVPHEEWSREWNSRCEADRILDRTSPLGLKGWMSMPLLDGSGFLVVNHNRMQQMLADAIACGCTVTVQENVP